MSQLNLKINLARLTPKDTFFLAIFKHCALCGIFEKRNDEDDPYQKFH